MTRLQHAALVTDAQRDALLAIARASVEACVNHRPPPPLRDLPLPDASGVFVTVKTRGELRGCLGTLECRRGLGEDVARCGAEAASIDPRFAPIAAAELP